MGRIGKIYGVVQANNVGQTLMCHCLAVKIPPWCRHHHQFLPLNQTSALLHAVVPAGLRQILNVVSIVRNGMGRIGKIFGVVQVNNVGQTLICHCLAVKMPLW